MSQVKRAALYAAISNPVMDLRILVQRGKCEGPDDTDEALYQLERAVWSGVCATLGLQKMKGGKLVFGRDHNWYMSRQNDPLDWDYKMDAAMDERNELREELAHALNENTRQLIELAVARAQRQELADMLQSMQESPFALRHPTDYILDFIHGVVKSPQNFVVCEYCGCPTPAADSLCDWCGKKQSEELI